MPGDIQKALDTIKAKLPVTEKYVRYYDGEHPLTFASKSFQTAFGQVLRSLHDNLCPIVVDAPADRMEVINFSGDDPKVESAVAVSAWALWQRETLELLSNDVHKEALKTGDAYLIVWPDEFNVSQFYAQDSRQCAMIVDMDTGAALYGAKQWMTEEKRVRLTLYYSDRIEKYISIKSYKTGNANLKEESFEPVSEEDAVTPNPYGVIPMFWFRTDAVLNDAIPLQDALNKTFADRLVTQEFGAFRQRWATGLEPPVDELTGVPKMPFEAGIAKMWFTNDKDVKFGDFDATALEPYLKAADSDRLEMARVTGTPLHFFSINVSDAISGKALKTLESRFTKKVTRLCLNFGTVWANVMKFALAIEGQQTADNITTQWAPAETQDEAEQLANAEAKQRLGVPAETIWEELGYTEEDITKFTAAKLEKQKEALEMAQATKPAFNGKPV